MQAKEGDLVRWRNVDEVDSDRLTDHCIKILSDRSQGAGYGIAMKVIKDEQDPELRPALESFEIIGAGYIPEDDYPLVKIVWAEGSRTQVVSMADIIVEAQAKQPSD
tara:strand:+ start:818 stop:1138 length:321 start_codon:yes stop_codon:yes gene_type:complete